MDVKEYGGEQSAVRTTIVGGRPPGAGQAVGAVPRGVEVLIKKAAVDAAFRDCLLSERDGAAAKIGLALEPAEAAMLRAIPAPQLEAVVARTRVSPNLHAAFMTYTAAVMLAALGALTAGCKSDAADGDDVATDAPRPTGIRPDWPPTAETAKTFSNKDLGAVEGKVVTEDGAPIAGALLVVSGTDWFTTTDADGNFSIAAIPPGEFYVKALRVGFYEVTMKAAVEAGYITFLTFTLPGESRDSNGKGPIITGIRPDLPAKDEGD